MTNASSFAPGLILDGRYRLERLLGEGGMGTVWVAKQITLDRSVAIKALRAGRFENQSRLEREARLLASLYHSAIVQVFDFGRTEQNLSYVVMELVQGTSLEAHLVQAGPLSCEAAVSLMLPLLEGLAAVHAAGIVHRDIKPANILLATEGRLGVMPKLLDFGIARNEDAVPLTMDGTLVGTPAYMAPEQFQGLRADARADLWAIAETLYDMVTGEPPFVGDNLFELMRKVRDEPVSFPRRARGLDGKLWSLLTETLRKNPDERPATALVLHQRLAEWLNSRGGARTLTKAQVPVPTASALEREQVATQGASGEGGEPPTSTFDALIRARLGER